MWWRAADQRPDRLVRARRILDQEDEQRPVADRDALEASEGAAEGLEAGNGLVEARAERSRERRSRERVVDVVEARQPQRPAPRPPGRDEVEGRVVDPRELDRPRGD